MSAGRERHDTQLHVTKPERFRERIQLLRHNDRPAVRGDARLRRLSGRLPRTLRALAESSTPLGVDRKSNV